MPNEIEITKGQFLAYERVRRSGVTNMFDARVVGKLANLTREQILEIMKTYEKLYEQHIGPMADRGKERI